MEQVLDLYEQQQDSKHPVVCFDERPCQLLDDVLMPTSLQPGKPIREDYEYSRQGTCVVLMAFEPRTGKRIAEVREHRTKKDFAQFMDKLSQEYPQAESIRLVLDNLNTHRPASFYTTFPAAKACALRQRFEMIYTPKHASWLNMIEIEFSALSRQCLLRRIKDRDIMCREVEAWVKDRNDRRVTIDWSFTTDRARNKFINAYQKIINV